MKLHNLSCMDKKPNEMHEKLNSTKIKQSYHTLLIHICDCLSKTRLVRTCQHFEKYHFKNSIKKPALPWYWTHSLSIITLSYLLAIVQLT